MEARLEAISSPTRLWWTKLGMWQALMVVVTLGVSFVTLSVTGDIKVAVVTVFVAFATVTFAAAVFVAFTAAFAAAVVVVAATAVTAVVAFVATAVTAAAVVVVAATAAVAFVALADEVPGVSRKAIWLSYAGEFLLILLPMLWVVLRG